MISQWSASLLWICLLSWTCLPGRAGAGPDEAPGIRLSGAVIVSATERMAVIEYEGGGSCRVRSGDTVTGWGRVRDIEKDRIVFESPEGLRVLHLSAGSGEFKATPIPQEEAARPSPAAVSAVATPEVADEIRGLARDPNATGEDLNEVLAPLLDLPPASRIVAVDHRPLSGDESTLVHIRKALAQGNTVRFSIEGGEVEAIYLSPASRARPGNAGQPSGQ